MYNYLTGESLDNVPTFGVAHLAIDVDDWTDVGPRTARTELYLEPKQI